MLQLTVWSIPSALALAVTGVVWHRLLQSPKVPGIDAMRWLLAGVAVWSFAQLLGTLVTDLDLKIWATKLEYPGVLATPIAWFVFAVTYARGLKRPPPRLVAAISAVPAVTVALVMTNEWHLLMWVDAETVMYRDHVGLYVTHGPWFAVSAVYSYGLVFAATVILAYALSQSRQLIRPLIAVISAPLVVALFNITYLAPWNPVPGVDFTPLSFAVAAVILDHGVLRYGLLDIVPVMRHRVVEKLTDGVVIIDRKGRIIDANPSALALLSLELTRSLNSPVEDMISNSTLLELMHGNKDSAEITVKNRAYDVITTALDESDDQSDVVLVFRDITTRRKVENELTRATEELERLAHTDSLTGLYNRRYFLQRLTEEAERVRRHGSSVSVLLYDLDYFKQVNDTHGHEAGDRVLQEISRVTARVKRVTDVSARVGGEEFALLLPETEQKGAIQLAQRLRSAIEQAKIYDEKGTFMKVTASIGVATVNQVRGDPEQLLSYADQALYRAKNNGRNMVCT